MIKDFGTYLNENSSEIFSKKRTYLDDVKSHVIQIIMDENGISEKSFKEIDKVMDICKKSFEISEFIKQTCDEFEFSNKRSEYCAEYIYNQTKEILFKI